MTWKFGRQTPDQNLMRFVARRLPNPSLFLDIGSGEGSNARELRARKHRVVTVDIDPNTDPTHACDICDLEPLEQFDCIYDINTLCHVEAPPFAKIKQWLKPDGYFFSICPQLGTCGRVTEGKDFTRLIVAGEALDMLAPYFSHIRLGSQHYQLPGQPFYGSLIIEAQ